MSYNVSESLLVRMFETWFPNSIEECNEMAELLERVGDSFVESVQIDNMSGRFHYSSVKLLQVIGAIARRSPKWQMYYANIVLALPFDSARTGEYHWYMGGDSCSHEITLASGADILRQIGVRVPEYMVHYEQFVALDALDLIDNQYGIFMFEIFDQDEVQYTLEKLKTYYSTDAVYVDGMLYGIMKRVPSRAEIETNGRLNAVLERISDLSDHPSNEQAFKLIRT